jgi:YD repeat-containing protein
MPLRYTSGRSSLNVLELWRTLGSSIRVTADVSYTYDFQGRPIQTVWPTGATVDTLYTASGFADFDILSWDDVMGQPQTATVSHTYDEYGLASKPEPEAEEAES